MRHKKRKAEKEEQERERIRLYHELDVEGHFFKALPIQLNPPPAESEKTIHEIISPPKLCSQRPTKPKDTNRRNRREQRIVENPEQKRKCIQAYHDDIDVESQYFNNSTLIRFDQFATPNKGDFDSHHQIRDDNVHFEDYQNPNDETIKRDTEYRKTVFFNNLQ